jgi:hypothetical protein
MKNPGQNQSINLATTIVTPSELKIGTFITLLSMELSVDATKLTWEFWASV